MKKFFLVFSALCFFFQSFAFSGYYIKEKKANEIFIPIGKDMKISLQDLSIIKEKDLEKLTRNHLNFFERLSFRSAQKKLRNSINADGTVNDKKLLKYLNQDPDNPGEFNLGGFALGLLLGPIGVLIAYLVGGNNRPNRMKWAWIGFGVLVVALLITLLLG